MAAVFREGFVEADGFHIRYMAAGEGTPLVIYTAPGGCGSTRRTICSPPSSG